MNYSSSNKTEVSVAAETISKKTLFMKKIKKISFVGLSYLAFSLFFSACSDKVQCNNDLVLETVDSLLLFDDSEPLINYVLMQYRKEEAKKMKSDNAFASQMLQNGQMDGILMVAIQMQKLEENSEIGKNYKELITIDEKTGTKLPLIATQYKDIVTISKDKENNKIDCQASLYTETSLGNYVFDLKYTARPTDDNEDIYVQLESLESK